MKHECKIEKNTLKKHTKTKNKKIKHTTHNTQQTTHAHKMNIFQMIISNIVGLPNYRMSIWGGGGGGEGREGESIYMPIST